MHSKGRIIGQVVIVVAIVFLLPSMFCLLELWFPQWSNYPIFWATLVSEVSVICTAILLSRINRIIIKLVELNRENRAD